MAPWRTALLLLAAAAVAAAARRPPPLPSASAAEPAEPGEGEAAVLMELATAMGAPPDLLASWNETLASEGSLCGWPSSLGLAAYPRILCDNATGAITEIHLGEELSGTIPAEGWQALEALVTLNLSGTGVSGPLAAAFPDGLQDLLLDGNALTSISPAWRPPPHLHTLLLVHNQLNQTVGQQQGWLAEAGELRALNLAYNSLQGSLPADLALPPSLTALGLFHNRLTGTLPPVHLPDTLQSLDMSNNLLSGSLPAEWELPRSLVWLRLVGNHFDGTLPASMKLPAGLKGLEIGDNLLSGSIPEGWLPHNLTFLYARNNHFSLPSDGRLRLPASLHLADFSGNALSGPFPDDWTTLPQLTGLFLSNCQLSGTLPAAPLPPSLWSLSAASNDLTGSVPWAAWALPDSFLDLDLAYNNLTGSLPPALPASLQEMSLRANALTGSLPAELLERLPQLTNLSTFDVSHNRLTGRLPQALVLPPGHPELAMTVDLSNNSFSGPLPAAWDCGSARGPDSRLSLSGNQLRGTLPASPSLLAFGTVDLSGNRLTGTLPAWDPEGRQAGARVIVLPQQGAGFCGQVPSFPLDPLSQPRPVFFGRDPATGQVSALQPGALPPCPAMPDPAPGSGS